MNFVCFRHFASALLLISCLIFCGGCELVREALEEEFETATQNPASEDYRPRFVVALFSIVQYPRATLLEKEITSSDGRSVWINTNQQFDSKRIRDARAIPRPGDPDVCDLEFRIDRMGKSHWQMLVAASRGEPVALVIDSRYIGNFVPEVPRDDDRLEWVHVRIGVDSYTARGVARFAKKNYAHYNPSASDWFNFGF